MKIIIFLLFTGFVSLAFSMKSNLPVSKQNLYIEKGFVRGGESGGAFTLLGVRRHFAVKENVERIFIDLGDDKGAPLQNRISYFQATLEPQLSRLTLDLSQMKSTAVTPADLEKLFKASPFVKSTRLTYDPTDGGLTLVLSLKQKVRMEAFGLPSETQKKDKSSRIVIDLTAEKRNE